MDFLTPLTSLITLVLGVSLAVERVIEILKGIWPRLATAQEDLKLERRRCASMHILAVLMGTIVAFAGHIDFFQKLTGSTSQHLIWGYFVCGLLSAGGSAFWNHLLDIVKAAKITRELQAEKITKSGNTLIPA